MKQLIYTTIFVLIGCSSLAQKNVQLTYIGNMGVLISDHSQSILIDGLHKKYKAYYQYPSNELVKKIIANKSYPNISVLLSTHIHKDHFDPNLVLDFLEKNPKAILIGPSQTKEAITNTKDLNEICERIEVISYQENATTNIKHQGIDITGFYLNHANAARHSKVENIGYLIKIGKKKILHVGDTDWNKALFEVLDLKKEQIDIAILPNWLAMYEEGIAVINRYIQPKQIIATHISPFEQKAVKTTILKNFPNAVLFTEIGQEMMLEN